MVIQAERILSFMDQLILFRIGSTIDVERFLNLSKKLIPALDFIAALFRFQNKKNQPQEQ